MSKNFELMQRAGKAWDVAPAIAPKKDAAPPAPAPPLPLLVRREPWKGASSPGALDLDQLAREEALRLVQRIFLLQPLDSPRAIVFAGIDHGVGCSRICAQAADALQASIQGSVCLVEANLRCKPSAAAPKMIPANHYGLTDALVTDGPIRSFARPTQHGNMWLLSCGSLAADSHGLLNSDRLKPRFDELRAEFDFVLVDAPPLTRYSDAVALGKVADGLVLVLEANSTRRDATLRVSDNLRASRIRVLGAVLNKRTFPIPQKLYQRL